MKNSFTLLIGFCRFSLFVPLFNNLCSLKKIFYSMRVKSAVAFLILFLSLAADVFGQPQYYNYNNVGTSSNIFPFAVVAGKEVQWLFLAGDLNQPSNAPPGNITKIYIFMTGTSTNTLTNLTVKMGQTAITSLPSGTIYTGQLDTVYYSASVQLSSTNLAWMSITLDRPYTYNPTMSLVVDISQC